ncbi:hypothetical protein NQ317_012084 [Molorchus minor]|uniref:Uncharacterized protein n=1 Tax=Molorchus minor TaxID=1323400 RepID=A0ABQ9JK34_9CUCU|nr:hypothetical protein NQ317_012084 [Molorchus minor]
MFAQSRNNTYEKSKESSSTYKDNLTPNQVSGGLSSFTQKKQANPEDREFDEMANWLGKTSGGEESVSSHDFERFLAERAAAAENLPSVAGTTNASTTGTSKQEKKTELFSS